jgi:predicted permease
MLTILSTMLPIVVTLLLGFVAAWHHDFTAKEATILNRMVLTYAVPLAVFVGTVGTSRDQLIQSIPLALAILVGIVGMYLLVYLLCRFVLRFTMTTSALAAMAASGPSVPFLGPSILGGVFGASSAVPIAMGSIIINITIVPFTIFLLTMGSARERAAVGASVGAAVAVPQGASAILVDHLKETIRKPLVWGPILAFAIVLLNIHVPSLVSNSFLLLGHASSGVALFAGGIVLAAYKVKLDWHTGLFALLKNVVQPALLFGALVWLGFSGSVVSPAVMTMSIPAMPIVVMLALEFGVAEAHAPSMLLISTLASPFTIGAFMALMR